MRQCQKPFISSANSSCHLSQPDRKIRTISLSIQTTHSTKFCNISAQTPKNRSIAIGQNCPCALVIHLGGGTVSSTKQTKTSAHLFQKTAQDEPRRVTGRELSPARGLLRLAANSCVHAATHLRKAALSAGRERNS